MGTVLRLLFLEDPVNDNGEIIKNLKTMGIAFEERTVYDIPAFISTFQDFSPDVVLAACAAPGCNGHQVFQILKGTPTAFVPIAEVGFEEDAINLMRDGASDYLMRDRLQRLPFVILNILERAGFQAQKQHMVSTLKHERKHISELLLKMPAAVCILSGPDHVFQIANPFYHQISGQEELVGKALKTVFAEQKFSWIMDVVDGVYRTGTTYIDHEVSIPQGEGCLYINFVVQALKNRHGVIEGILVFGIDVTEEVVSRKEVERVNQEIDRLFESVDEGFFVKDVINDKFQHLSVGCPKIYGYTFKEFYEQPSLWYEVILQEDLHIAENDNVLLNQGRSSKSQYRIQHKDGSIRWIEVKTVPHLVDGRLITIDGVVSDITAHKLTEDKVAQMEALLSEAQHLAQMGNWNYDLVRQELTWSDGLKKIYWGDKSLIPENEYFENLIHPDDRLRTEGELDRLIKIGKSMKTTFRIINDHGEVKLLKGENRVELDEHGRPLRLYGILQDVTAIHMAEETLKKSEANLRTLLSHTDAAYILVDHQLNIVSCSHLAKEIAEFQGHSEPLEGSSILKYFAAAKQHRLKKIIGDVVGGKNISYETNYLDKDGFEKWYALKWIGVNDNEHKNWGFILSVKDITKVKLEARERNRMTAELIKRNKDLEQFTYVVSHNLRAPVANIIGLSDLLGALELEESGAPELITGLRKSVKSLDTVIKDLNYILQVKEVSTGKKTEHIDLQDIVDEIKLSINNLIVQEEVTFEYHLEQAQVYTVRSYLYSIFYNLILNSIKYRNRDLSPRVVIRSYISAQKLYLIFEDNGKGIDLIKHKNQIFGLYKRFDQEIEGKGMGLFMVKTQLEELGGTIEVKSELGMGTRFSITLPDLSYTSEAKV